MYAEKRVSPEIHAILQRCAIAEGSQIFLNEQLSPDDYAQIKKIVAGLGGKWNRKTRAHDFAFNIEAQFDALVDNGAYIDRKIALQYYATPPELARSLVVIADPAATDDVLEPSAGQGAIVEAARPLVRHLTAVEN